MEALNPTMRTVVKEENILRSFSVSKVAPAFGYYGPNSGCIDGFQQSRCHLLWLIDNDAAESYVDWWGPSEEELAEIRWWLVLWRVAEEEPADI
jgi:hypothetical protein